MGLNLPAKQLFGIALAAVLFIAACSGDSEAEVLPDQSEAPEPAAPVHELPPTDEMMEIARSQCEDGREQGIVELVRPGTDDVVSRAVVDCF